MRDITYLAVPGRHIAVIRAAARELILYLVLLLIGILAIPTLLLISILGALWELADFTLRAVDSQTS